VVTSQGPREEAEFLPLARPRPTGHLIALETTETPIVEDTEPSNVGQGIGYWNVTAFSADNTSNFKLIIKPFGGGGVWNLVFWAKDP